MDIPSLRWSWDLVAQYGDQVPLHFYSQLFLARPDLRPLFPVSMAAQRDRLVSALGSVVSQVDQLDSLVPMLQQLGRDHRKFEVVPDYYAAVGDALVATLGHFAGDNWSAGLAEEWGAAYLTIARVMIDAARDAGAATPAWWEAEVVRHERRTVDIAVITLRPDPVYTYAAGQSFALECPSRPRVWRYFSAANAPRFAETIEIHVRLIPGGQLSPALVCDTRMGDILRLGSPVGDGLSLAQTRTDDLVMIGGGTGTAPLLAIAEQAVADLNLKRLRFVCGANTASDLYNTQTLRNMAVRHTEFELFEAVASTGGHAVEVALLSGGISASDIYVCGSDVMVSGTIERLLEVGVDPAFIHYESFNHPAFIPVKEDAV